MKFVKIFGFILTLAGLGLSFPPVAAALAVNLGELGSNGGLVVFAVGWALLLGALAFHVGLERQKMR